MAPGRKRGAKGLKTKSELSLGDLVLAKVKGFPAWPAKIGRPEDWERVPDPKKYFVQFFGTSEIAFVAPADIQSFTNEAKNKLSARCLGKTVKYFAQAVKEICDEFEELQQKKVSGVGDDNGTQTHSSGMQSVDPAVDDALDVSQTNGILPECKLETKESVDVGSDLEHCPHKQDEVECNDVKPYLSDDVNRSLSPPVSSRKRKKLSANDSNLLKDSLTVSSPSQHSCKKEDPLDIKVKGSQNELTNGDRPKLAMESKKKSQAAVLTSGGSAVPRDRSAEILRRKLAGGIMKLSSSDSKLQLDVTGEKREKRLVKEKRHSEAPDDGQKDAKVKSESHNDAISQKKLKVQHGREKQGPQINEASFSAKISKTADTAKYPNLTKAQVNSTSDSRSPNVLDAKMANKELKRHTPVEKALPTKLPVVNNTDANHLSDEDDHPPIKRHRRESEAMSGSENRLGTSVSQKTDAVLPSKQRSPVVQLSMKRRSLRLCDDDDDDELPKTPIHGGATSKVSVTQRASDSKKKSVTRGEGCANDLKASRNSGKVDDGIKEQEHSGGGMNKVLPPAAKHGMEKRTREYPAALLSPSSRQLESEKLAPMNSEKIGPRKVVPVSVSPKRSSQHIGGARLSGELESKQPNKVPGSDFQRKSPVGDIKKSASSDRLNLDPSQSLCERSSQPSSGEKKKTTAKSDSRINDTAVGSSNENIKPVHERPSAGKDKNATHVVDSKTSDSVTSIKHLIAAAQARKKQTHLQNTYGNPFLFPFPDVDMVGRGRSPPPAALAYEASKTLQQDVLGPHHTSPCSNVQQTPSNNQHENDELEERRVSSGHQGTGSSLSGGTEAAVARDAFEGMIETLSRTKESIARATRLAIDCAKFGLASEVVELLIQKLENEPSLHRRVDLFFLVDSITQCSHTQRGASYVYTIQAALPRLIGAAAPAGAGAQENRRQCRKVLRLWLERKILPESVLRRHMDDLGVVNDDTAISHRRPSRAERAIDDPIREMEGMVVDEYGSNAMFQLPGLVLVNVFEEEEDDEDAADTNLCVRDDDKSPCKHTPVTSRDPENCSVTPSDRRHCILEEVDGELEMEDVSGHHKDERPLVNDGSVDLALLELNPDGLLKSPSNISTEYLPSPEGSPPLPPGSPPPTPPLPTSPPPSSPPPPPPPLSSPPQPPPPPPPPPTTQQHPFPQPPVPPQPPIGPPPHVGPTPPVGPLPPHLRPPPHMGPLHPPFGPPPHLSHPVQLTTQQSFPSQPPLVSQNKTPPALPHPLPHEVGTTQTANQQSVTGSTAHGSHNDASGRGEVLPQQPSHFPPSGASIAREHGGYNSSRHGEDDAYMNPQASQLRQQYLPASVPFPPRPVHTELPAQRPPSHFPYPNSAHQHQYNSYSIPNFSDGQRRYVADEQWRKQGNDFNANHPRGGWTPGGRPYSHEGYHERPPASAINFQHSAPNNLPSSGQIPVHGVPMMGSRPNMSTVNWRPA